MNSPYRKSIWDVDENYNIEKLPLDLETLKLISKLISIDAAKKNVPPVSLLDLLKISSAAKTMNTAKNVTIAEVEEFLESLLNIKGAGIPTLICMLAVESNGDYPPMDRKFSHGLYSKLKISSSEKRALSRNSIAAFAKVYVEKVIPAWVESRINMSPQEADNFWGRGGVS